MANHHGFPTPKDILEIHDEIEREYELKYTGVRVAAPKLKLRRLLDRVDEYEGT